MRPCKCRHIHHTPNARFFKPQGIQLRDLDVIIIKDEELEAIRLADAEGMDQVQAAALMNISRPTFSRLVGRARKQVALALTKGMALKIEGGENKLVKQPTKKGKDNATS